MTNHFVFDRKTVYMQRIADFVRAGYRYWAAGEVRPERATPMARKFDRLYGTGHSRHQRAYARAQGAGCAVLLLYAPYAAQHAPAAAVTGQHVASEAPTTDVATPHAADECPYTAALRWILLVTPGEHLAHQSERLADAWQTEGRIALTGYELVQLSRPGQVEPSWTWRMQGETYQGWRLRVIAAASHGAPRLTGEMAQLVRTPGFAGCRAQAKRLLVLAKNEHRRRFPGTAALPAMRVPYVQRLPNSGIALAAWLRRYTHQASRAANTRGGCLPR